MIKEIGGYFECEKNSGDEYYDYLAFNTGRDALKFIIERRNIKKIYLPYYLCKVVRDTLEKEGVEIIYYHINEHFEPIIDDYDNSIYLYLVNYFGILSREDILRIRSKFEKIILDNTHAFFLQINIDADIIYNTRKYFGVCDGAYLKTDLEGEELPLASSTNRLSYLFGRMENDAESFYKSFIKSEESLNNNGILGMSKITHNMLKGIDYKKVKAIREVNYNLLGKELNRKNKLKNMHSAFMYPLLVEDGKKLKKKLIENKIYVPTLWDNYQKPLNDFEKDLLDNLVLLPIDQRYTRDDMQRIIDVIGFGKKR